MNIDCLIDQDGLMPCGQTCPDCGLKNGELCQDCAKERIEDQKNFCDCKELGGCICELKDVEPLHPSCSNDCDIDSIRIGFDDTRKNLEYEREYLEKFGREFGQIETRKLTQKDTEQMNGLSTLQKPDIDDLNDYW